MLAFNVPGLERFATTGEYKDETEWRNPGGSWFREIIPTGCQLNELNKDVVDYDPQDDSFEGRLTLSSKGTVSTLLQHRRGRLIHILRMVADFILILRMMNSTHP